MHLKKYWALVLGLIILSVSAQSQPTSLFRYRSDTTSAVKRELAMLVSRPFSPQYDSVLKNISILMSYNIWSKSYRIDYATPIKDVVDITTHKAQSEWLLGMFKVAVLQDLIKMESGVLPLLDVSVAHLDTSAACFGRVNKYMVGQAKLINQIDSSFAKMIELDLKDLLKKIENEASFESAKQFDLKTRGYDLFALIEKKYSQNDIEQSLSYWLVSSLVGKNDENLIKDTSN